MRLRRGIRMLAMLTAITSGSAAAMPIPFADRPAVLAAREQPIAAFVQDLFGRLDIPVVVSPAVKGAVNGNFGGPAERTWRDIARAFNLVEYYDGSVLHVYAPSETGTRTLPLAPAAAQRVLRTVDELQLADARNTLRATAEGTLVATGAQRFLEQVQEIARAQLASERSAASSALKVFYLRYAWAQDVTIAFGGRQVVVPGVATIVRALMAGQTESRIAVSTLETPASGTVPGLRGLRMPRALTDAAALGALGAAAAGADPGSAPVVAQAFGIGTPPAAAPPAPPPAAGDAVPVRVEADSRLNAVVVRDAPERLPQYEQLVAALDVEPQLLEIEATIIDLDTERLRELGINWRLTTGDFSLLFGRGDESDLRLSPSTPVGEVTPSGAGGFVSAVIGGANQFIARINALQNQGAAKIVSSPQVLTLSNVEAVFDNSSTFYVRVAGREDVDLFNVSAGTTLRVTPHVFKDGGSVRIKMLVSIEDGALSARTVDTLPVVNRSAVSTQALIVEGESLLVGGITRESSGEQVTQVPVLGDVPVLGHLFRSTSRSAQHVERLFLIQPRLAGARRVAAASGAGRPRAATAEAAAAAASAPDAGPAAATTLPAAPASTAPVAPPEPEAWEALPR